MKKIISAVLVCILLVGCMLTLASCSKKLSGTYKGDAGIGSATYEFSGKKVIITAELLTMEKKFEGKYEINEDEDGYTITFTFKDDEAESYSGEFSFAEGEENGVEYIKIGGIKYKKVG